MNDTHLSPKWRYKPGEVMIARRDCSGTPLMVRIVRLPSDYSSHSRYTAEWLESNSNGALVFFYEIELSPLQPLHVAGILAQP